MKVLISSLAFNFFSLFDGASDGDTVGFLCLVFGSQYSFAQRPTLMCSALDHISLFLLFFCRKKTPAGAQEIIQVTSSIGRKLVGCA